VFAPVVTLIYAGDTVRIRRLQTALLICPLLCGCGHLYRPDSRGLQQETASAAPLGASPAQVTAYLNGKKFAHSAYKRDPLSGNTIEATMLVSTPHALVEPSYAVVFRFNDRNRLAGYDVQYLGYLGF
jgi:hypothetical protein